MPDGVVEAVATSAIPRPQQAAESVIVQQNAQTQQAAQEVAPVEEISSEDRETTLGRNINLTA